MLGRLVAAFLAVSALLPSCQAGWKNCGADGSVFTVTEVTLAPEPVKPGDVAQFAIQATSSKGVSGGVVQMVVHYVGVPVWTQTDNLCDKVDACPITPGPITVHYSQLFPLITPPGPYEMTLTGHSGADQLFCVQVTFSVVPPSMGSSNNGATDERVASGGGSASGLVELAAAAKGAAQTVLRVNRKLVS